MKQQHSKKLPKIDQIALDYMDFLRENIAKSWEKIAPFWPLKNLIAVNPMAGFEPLPFEEAFKQGKAYFQQADLPTGMQVVNRETIKWLQAFFDEGQSVIQMPGRCRGFLKTMLSLIPHDHHIVVKNSEKQRWLHNLPQETDKVSAVCLEYLGITPEDQEVFLVLLLTTLPGWAAYIQYYVQGPGKSQAKKRLAITQEDYTAFRLVVLCLMWPNAHELIAWHQRALKTSDIQGTLRNITQQEQRYRHSLLKKVKTTPPVQKTKPDLKAQLVFCIDVRSEPFRRTIEAQGAYETYGFAGFFGLPIMVQNPITEKIYSSCPVLLQPAHTVTEKTLASDSDQRSKYTRFQMIQKLYQTTKYTFTVPFSLVEAIGFANGLWMAVKTFMPKCASALRNTFRSLFQLDAASIFEAHSIPLEKQVIYGANALKMMGLTESFAPLVVLCGHSSTTQNNAYATFLQCGACAGHAGGPNAQLLACILNTPIVRKSLEKKGISIPDTTLFVAAEHNTTTDAVKVFDANGLDHDSQDKLLDLKKDLEVARLLNSQYRSQRMGVSLSRKQAAKETMLRSQDWAQVRPEWGLARNASFVVGPRSLTQHIDLEGRSFLHSYEWSKDLDGSFLTTILTAPVIVAQWINAQYFFSTLDNIAFGGGSKITKNITGKIGIMQGNASDLMHGLPLQSVYESDHTPYHQPLRLTVVVYAPKNTILRIVKEHPILKKLVGNGWIYLVCFDPKTSEQLLLKRSLVWEDAL
jgi:uncharacterized protein YbcC (UPF0753/DUF2309 family)